MKKIKKSASKLRVPASATSPTAEIHAPDLDAADLVEVVAPAPSKAERKAMLTMLASKGAEQNPVSLYLARFNSDDGRRAQLAGLRTISRALNVENPYDLPWKDLRYQHVVAIREKLVADERAPATVNRLLCAVRGVAQEAMRIGVLPPDEYARIEDVKGVRGSRLLAGRHLDETEDLEPLFAAAEEHANPAIAIRDRALLGVLRVTGMRRAELVSLKLQDLDKNWSMKIRGKGDKERMVYLGAVAEDVLAWLKVRTYVEGPLFCAVHKSGKVMIRPMGESSVQFIIDRAKTAAVEAGHDIQHVSAHDFRRTFVGDLLDSGADAGVVQRLAGHADASTTLKYDRRPEKVAEAAAARLSVPKRKVGGADGAE